jgi:hypothetical protein
MTSVSQFLKLQENILDPIKSELDPEIWNKEKKLKRSVRVHITKTLDKVLTSYTKNKPTHIAIHGSLTGYQYLANSDLDVMFVIDVDEATLEKMAAEMPHGVNLPGTKHPFNWFASNKMHPEWKKMVRYDVIKDKWLLEPKEDIKASAAQITSYRVVIEISRFFLAGLDALITEFHADKAAYNEYEEYLKTAKTEEDKKALTELLKFKLEEIISDIDGVRLARHMLWTLRQEAYIEDEDFEINTKIEISDNHDYSINNIIFKYIEKLGYFKTTKDIVNEKDEWISKREKI